MFMLTGCGGGSSNSGSISSSDTAVKNTVDSTSDETSNTMTNADNEDATINTNALTIDDSLMTCEDDLSDVLELINQLRIQNQTCGESSYPAVAEVTLNNTLISAATEHSNNMANYNFFSHTGLDGSTVGTRVTAQGYTWSRVSENIAGGLNSAQAVVDGWMSSEGHCANIMNAEVTEMGLACQVNSDADYQYYWTQVFAKPR